MRAALICAAALLALGAAFASPATARDRFDPMEMLAKSDANGDGRVSRSEYIDARRDRFERMDRNNDGYFTEDDLPRIARKRGGEKVDRVIEALDANRDGRLSRPEFVDGPTRLFDLGDRDRNGVIDRAEMDRLQAMIAARGG